MRALVMIVLGGLAVAGGGTSFWLYNELTATKLQLEQAEKARIGAEGTVKAAQAETAALKAAAEKAEADLKGQLASAASAKAAAETAAKQATDKAAEANRAREAAEKAMADAVERATRAPAPAAAPAQ